MINVRVITPHGIYLNENFVAITCKSVEGTLSIYQNHIPALLVLETSILTLKNDQKQEFAISGGMLSFSDNVATILTDSIESKDEIDLDRAKKAKEQALKNIEKAKESFELKQAELALARAINRINVKSKK